MDPRIIELRVHTELVDPPEAKRRKPQAAEDAGGKWPASVLLLDCETTIDARQSLTFGGYQYCRWRHGRYAAVEQGLFYDDALDPDSLAILQRYATAHGLRLCSRTDFVKRVLLRSIRAQTLIVCFNAPFDLSRIACEGTWTLRRGGGWSFTLVHYRDKDDGQPREDTFKPRLVITPKDGKGAFFRLTTASTKRTK